MTDDTDSGRDSIGTKSEMRRMEAFDELKAQLAQITDLKATVNDQLSTITKLQTELYKIENGSLYREVQELRAENVEIKLQLFNVLESKARIMADNERMNRIIKDGHDITLQWNEQLNNTQKLLTEARAEVIGLRELNSKVTNILAEWIDQIESLKKEVEFLNAKVFEKGNIAFNALELLSECETALERIRDNPNVGKYADGSSESIAEKTLAKLKQMRGGE